MNQSMLDHGDVQERLPDFLLDEMSDDERRAIDAHLSICPECRALHDRLADGLASLGTLAPQVEMPPGHRQRFLDRLGEASSTPEPVTIADRHPAWRRYAIAATIVALIGAVALAIALGRSGDEERILDPRAAHILAESPAAIPLIADEATDAYGTLFVAPDATEALLVVDDLPRSERDTVYQVWLIRDGIRTSGGVFTVEGYNAATIVSAPEPLSSYQSMGITVEPGPDGSPEPTGPRVVSCSLEGLAT